MRHAVTLAAGRSKADSLYLGGRAATAVKGAGGGIQWIGPDAVDPLDAS